MILCFEDRYQLSLLAGIYTFVIILVIKIKNKK